MAVWQARARPRMYSAQHDVVDGLGFDHGREQLKKKRRLKEEEKRRVDGSICALHFLHSRILGFAQAAVPCWYCRVFFKKKVI